MTMEETASTKSGQTHKLQNKRAAIAATMTDVFAAFNDDRN